jgi:hypothetical protein
MLVTVAGTVTCVTVVGTFTVVISVFVTVIAAPKPVIPDRSKVAFDAVNAELLAQLGIDAAVPVSTMLLNPECPFASSTVTVARAVTCVTVVGTFTVVISVFKLERFIAAPKPVIPDRSKVAFDVVKDPSVAQVGTVVAAPVNVNFENLSTRFVGLT